MKSEATYLKLGKYFNVIFMQQIIVFLEGCLGHLGENKATSEQPPDEREAKSSPGNDTVLASEFLYRANRGWSLATIARNEPSRSLTFHNHVEGPY